MQFRHQPNEKTLAEIEQVLAFIRQHAPQLEEKAGNSKWTEGHVIFCEPDEQEGMYSYMVGALKNGKVTWHMMPYYGLADMREKWAEDMAPFVSGKSCIQFKHFADLPTEALQDIVTRGTPAFAKIMAARSKR